MIKKSRKLKLFKVCGVTYTADICVMGYNPESLAMCFHIAGRRIWKQRHKLR